MADDSPRARRRFPPVWHPQSTLLLEDPRCYATTPLLKMMLAAGSTRLIYSGDRMWPGVAFGGTIEAIADAQAAPLKRHDAVIVAPDGIPDLLRVADIVGDRVTLIADADPEMELDLPSSGILARVALRAPSNTRARRTWRRIRLDLREAALHRPDTDEDPADSVRDKYEMQAPFYSRVGGDPIVPALKQWLAARIPAGGRVLVVGSGAGKESIELARMGYRVHGVDFAPKMVELSQAAALEAGVDVLFEAADLRTMRLPPNSLDAVFFTYDVYSFIPSAGARLAVLRSLRDWTGPTDPVFLSARCAHDGYTRGVLALQWLCRTFRRERVSRGESHTRYVGTDGRLQRSFVHVFSESRLQSEIRASGFSVVGAHAGHLELRPSGDPILDQGGPR